MPASVKFNDLGIGKLRDELAALQREEITIGYQGASGAAEHPDAKGETVAQVAHWMEYGTPDAPFPAPARPFLRVTMTRAQAAIVEANARGLSDLVDGRADRPAIQARIGTMVVTKLRETILDAKSWAEPLAAATVRAKGHDDPLIDSGVMYESASYAVRQGDTIIAQGGEE